MECSLEFRPLCVGCRMIRNWKRFFPCWMLSDCCLQQGSWLLLEPLVLAVAHGSSPGWATWWRQRLPPYRQTDSDAECVPKMGGWNMMSDKALPFKHCSEAVGFAPVWNSTYSFSWAWSIMLCMIMGCFRKFSNSVQWNDPSLSPHTALHRFLTYWI